MRAAHTTFRIGGPADYFVVPEDAASLGRGVALCRAEGVDYFTGMNLEGLKEKYSCVVECRLCKV